MSIEEKERELELLNKQERELEQGYEVLSERIHELYEQRESLLRKLSCVREEQFELGKELGLCEGLWE